MLGDACMMVGNYPLSGPPRWHSQTYVQHDAKRVKVESTQSMMLSNVMKHVAILCCPKNATVDFTKIVELSKCGCQSI